MGNEQLSELRRLFEERITIREIAVPIVGLDAHMRVEECVAFLNTRRFDVVGVSEGGRVLGYVRRGDLVEEGTLADHRRLFGDGEVVPDTAPLLDGLEHLVERAEVFVSFLGNVSGIVTRADLQKQPVRMWLFGLVSLVEMRLLALVRRFFPNGVWNGLLPRNRLSRARQVFERRRELNEDIDLASCLQLSDKRMILLQSPESLGELGFDSEATGKFVLESLETLRNDLAHGQELLTGEWGKIMNLVNEAENIINQIDPVAHRVKNLDVGGAAP